jgi:hypothetical protein
MLKRNNHETKFDELSSARIWQHKLCATLSANVKYKLPSSNQRLNLISTDIVGWMYYMSLSVSFQ